MSWPVLLNAEAEKDLTAARDWYDQKRPQLGDEFLDEIAIAIQQLESAPELERLYFRNFRRVLLRRFPYKLFYQIIGDRVIVFRVLHAKQSHERGLIKSERPT
jgi:plasmid stabilization system protein ParE